MPPQSALETDVDIRGGVVIARGRGKDAGHLPVADNLIDYSGSVFSERSSAAEWQIVDITENKALTNIEIGIAVILFRIALVLKVSVVYRAQAGAGSVVERMRESVGGLDTEARET